MTRGVSAFAAVVLAIVLSIPVAGAAHARRQASTGTPARPQLLAQTPAGALTVPASISIDGSPSTVAADSNGTVYVGLNQKGPGVNTDVGEFDANGNFVRAFAAHLAGFSPLLAVGPDHNVYVWGTLFDPIREYAPGGALVRMIPLPSSIVRLTDLELDAAGNIFATGYDNNGSSYKVFRFDPAGNETASFALGPPGDPLSALAVDPDGTLWAVRQSGDVSVLLHVDGNGRDLKNAPYLGALDGGVKVTDLDFADGRLYSIGLGDPILGPATTRGKVVVSTFTPSGFLVGRVVGPELADYCCHGVLYSVAVVGNRFYATGLDTSKLASALAANDLRPHIGVLANAPVFPEDKDSYPYGKCGGQDFAYATDGTLSIPNQGHTGCDVRFANYGNPCSTGNKADPRSVPEREHHQQACARRCRAVPGRLHRFRRRPVPVRKRPGVRRVDLHESEYPHLGQRLRAQGRHRVVRPERRGRRREHGTPDRGRDGHASGLARGRVIRDPELG